MSFEVLLVYFLLLLLVAFGSTLLRRSSSVWSLCLKAEAVSPSFGFNLLTQFTGYYLPLNIYTILYCGFWAFGLISLCFLKTWL